MRLRPLLTRPWSSLELRRTEGGDTNFSFGERRLISLPTGYGKSLFPYSCSTACAIAGRLPKYCAFFSTNCFSPLTVSPLTSSLCAGYNPSFIGQLLHASKSALYAFSLSNQVIYASSRYLLVRSFRKLCIKQTLLRHYFFQIIVYIEYSASAASASAAAVCMYIYITAI